MTSRDCISPDSTAGPASRPPLPGQVVLVMQGGGAPGAYHGGVYQALHEAGIEPDWVIGTSIGAISGSIIAGNKVAHRLERLREFWSCIESRPLAPWGLISPRFGSVATSLTAALTGVPGFYSPNIAAVWAPQAAVGVEQAALYSVDPLKKLLPSLVDFKLANFGRPRFTLGAVNVLSGQMRYFDSRDVKIGLDHVLGSCALPPSFPAVRIDGDAYWDGGICSNTPIEAVFDDNPRRSSIVFAVQIWHARGPEPESVAQVLNRQKDIMFASRAKSHIPRQAQLHQMRHVIRELVEMLPEDLRNTPEARRLAAYGCGTVMHIVEINAPQFDGEGYSRDIDFSPASIQERWQAGYADTRRIIARRPWDDPVDPKVGIAVHASDGRDTAVTHADKPDF
jgi:NTE family protein